jgi:hypothetical protein
MAPDRSGFGPRAICGISPGFPGLSPTTGHVPTRSSPVRRWGPKPPARLACVKHAASVRSEPGSNSQVHHRATGHNSPRPVPAEPKPPAGRTRTGRAGANRPRRPPPVLQNQARRRLPRTAWPRLPSRPLRYSLRVSPLPAPPRARRGDNAPTAPARRARAGAAPSTNRAAANPGATTASAATTPKPQRRPLRQATPSTHSSETRCNCE